MKTSDLDTKKRCFLEKSFLLGAKILFLMEKSKMENYWTLKHMILQKSPNSPNNPRQNQHDFLS